MTKDNEAGVGDTVHHHSETRPLSKMKRWRLVGGSTEKAK